MDIILCFGHIRMIAVKYALFAGISIFLNLVVQYLIFRVYAGDLSLYLAMAAGTIAGLVAKYVLDKKYIFYHVPRSRRDDTAKFLLYSATGVFTTLIFWGTEIAFAGFFEHPGAKYFGAGIGLTIGYCSKFFLDKYLVFRPQDRQLYAGSVDRY